MSITLDDGHRTILRSCPITIITHRTPSKLEAARMKRVKFLWTAGLVSGRVERADTLVVRITDAGRVAIGRPALGNSAPEGV